MISPRPGSAADSSPAECFTKSVDIGNPQHAGSTSFDRKEQSYRLQGSGVNMWFAHDECHFAYREQRGDFLLRTHLNFVGAGVDPHRKAGLMIRSSLAEDAPYVDVAVHGDGLVSLQFRRAQGDETEEVKAEITRASVIQLEKKGNRFTMSVARFGEPFAPEKVLELDLGENVFAGLFVCSHNPEVIEECEFFNARVVVPAPDDFVPYRDYIGSRLEILDLESGHRRIVHVTRDSLQAPNWTRDGQALIFNRNGLLYRFDLQTAAVTEIPTASATRSNNDHAISFDGSMLAISHHAPEHEGHSVIYTIPILGGKPTQITAGDDHSYLHGWSPDGKWLTFTGQRNGKLNIYKIPSARGEEVQLTDSELLDDGPEFAPDGRKIYFNSARSGKMQLWRMDPDGSRPEQVTDDEYNNWFPHLAPDGNSFVYIAFSPEIDPENHPFYKHVTLRWRTTQAGPVRTLAYLYGGQGTINVASWSPDGKQIAFVSNSVIE